MRLAYLHCFAGISGDMFLGALVGAGVPVEVLRNAADALHLRASLAIETVDRSGISATKINVLEGERLADGGLREQAHELSPEHPKGEDDALPEQGSDRSGARSLQPRSQHLHKMGHAHTHEHTHEVTTLSPDNEHASRARVRESGPSAPGVDGDRSALPDAEPKNHRHAHDHTHGRSLTEIRALIAAAPLDDAVKRFAIRTFELLGAAEAKVHNVPMELIHFHEVGAVDAIVDIVAASAGIAHLAVDEWHCSPVNVGAGMVRCAHGLFPVPAPATADLLRGLPTYAAHLEQELVTPTGAALLRALEPRFGPQPAMSASTIGYGAGTRNPPDFPNVLRLTVGEQSLREGATPQSIPASGPPTEGLVTGTSASWQTAPRTTETVTVLETALDDLSPQITAYVAEQALALGALDVMLAPVVMKKGRPGTLLTVLCAPEHSAALEELLLRETSTLGVRRREEQRACLARRHVSVQTTYGPIHIKIATTGEGAERNAAPEFEDCRSAAQLHRVPLKQVQGAALAAYLRQADR